MPQRIDGSVMRQNVCQPLAPKVAAACSCSSPTSRSTGVTSRTTNGNDTKIVASTIPGTEKITWNGSSIQPSRPYTSTSASPITTGETANGRAINASTRHLPRNLPRASASAAITPKTVFASTAIAATSIVSQNALIAAGVLIESQT